MSGSASKYVGIDFSGDQAKWSPKFPASNVWIAVAEERSDALTLTSLQRVQQLPGQARPFARLAAWLSLGDYSAAGIDAPFSIPWWFFGRSLPDHPGLLSAVNALPLRGTMDFPTGMAFRECVAAGIPFSSRNLFG